MITPRDIPGSDRNWARRSRSIDVLYESLAKMLSLPDGFCVVCVVDDALRGTVRVVVCSESLGEVSEGVELPSLQWEPEPGRRVR